MTPAEALFTLLGQVDYTAGACRPNEMVSACLQQELIALCRKVLAEEGARLAGEPTYVDLPPSADRRIGALHVWIATHANAGEGVMSADVELPDGVGIRHMPLMSTMREVAERLHPLAKQVQREAKHQGEHIVTVRLGTFRRVQP